MGKKLLKAFASGSVLAAIAYIILGVVLIWKPEVSLITIVRIGGIAILLVGLFDIILYVFKDISGGVLNNLLSGGIILIVAGILVVVNPDMIATFIPIVLGCAIILGGLIKLQRSVDLLRLHYEGWIFVMVLAILDIAFGIVMVLNPFKAASTLMIVTGIGLLISGLTTLVTALIVGHKIKKIQQALEEEAPIEGVVEEEEAPAPAPAPVSSAQSKREARREKKREAREAQRLLDKAENDHNEAVRQQKEVDAILEKRLGPQGAAQEAQEQAPSGGYVPSYRKEEAAPTEEPNAEAAGSEDENTETAEGETTEN